MKCELGNDGCERGPNQAYLLFGIENIDNSGRTTNFAFDPTKLYVQQASQNFIDPSLAICPNILGVASAVLKGQTLRFAVSAEARL